MIRARKMGAGVFSFPHRLVCNAAEGTAGGATPPAAAPTPPAAAPAAASAPAQAPTPAPAAAAPAASPAPAAPEPPEPPAVDPEWLKKRLSKAEDKGSKAAWSELGFKSSDEAKAAMKELADLRTAKMTDEEKRAKELKDLKAQADRATTVEATYKSIVDAQFAKLPEALQTKIDARANGDSAKRWELMQLAEEFQSAAPPPAAPAAAPTPKPPAPASAGTPPPPRPAAAKTAYDEWVEKRTRSPLMADIYYRQNSAAIEASRPAQS